MHLPHHHATPLPDPCAKVSLFLIHGVFSDAVLCRHKITEGYWQHAACNAAGDILYMCCPWMPPPREV